jgi:hypothetical protein
VSSQHDTALSAQASGRKTEPKFIPIETLFEFFLPLIGERYLLVKLIVQMNQKRLP